MIGLYLAGFSPPLKEEHSIQYASQVLPILSLLGQACDKTRVLLTELVMFHAKMWCLHAPKNLHTAANAMDIKLLDMLLAARTLHCSVLLCIRSTALVHMSMAHPVDAGAAFFSSVLFGFTTGLGSGFVASTSLVGLTFGEALIGLPFSCKTGMRLRICVRALAPQCFKQLTAKPAGHSLTSAPLCTLAAQPIS